jgi:uncharacterized protein (DUF4415 family)
MPLESQARLDARLEETLASMPLDTRKAGQDQVNSNAPGAESLGADFCKSARVVMPSGKTSVHLRLDSDVVEWFKANGKGH